MLLALQLVTQHVAAEKRIHLANARVLHRGAHHSGAQRAQVIAVLFAHRRLADADDADRSHTFLPSVRDIHIVTQRST